MANLHRCTMLVICSLVGKCPKLTPSCTSASRCFRICAAPVMPHDTGKAMALTMWGNTPLVVVGSPPVEAPEWELCTPLCSMCTMPLVFTK